MQIPAINNLFKKVNKKEYAKYFELMPDFKKENTQKYTTIALTLVAVIILLIFAINPTLSTISNLQKQLNDSKFAENQLEQKINNLSVLQQQYSSLQNDLPVIYDAVPKNPQVANLVAQIQAVAQDSGVSLTTFQTFEVNLSQNPTPGAKYSSFDFSLSADGDYQSMVNFLNELVDIQRIISVDNIAISRKADLESSTLGLSVKGTAYFKQ